MARHRSIRHNHFLQDPRLAGASGARATQRGPHQPRVLVPAAAEATMLRHYHRVGSPRPLRHLQRPHCRTRHSQHCPVRQHPEHARSSPRARARYSISLVVPPRRRLRGPLDAQHKMKQWVREKHRKHRRLWRLPRAARKRARQSRSRPYLRLDRILVLVLVGRTKARVTGTRASCAGSCFNELRHKVVR